MMINTGSMSVVDHSHTAHFIGTLTQTATLLLIDSTTQAPMGGYAVIDSTRLLPDSTYLQGTVFGKGDPVGFVDGFNLPIPSTPAYDPTSFWANPDPPLYLTDTTYVGGTCHDGTYTDGTYMHRWFDPKWVNFSLWYTQDSSNNHLIGNRYREPVRRDVGNYYTSMVVPRQTGHYEIRWRYLKESGGYAHEVVQGFLCKSAGIDADRS